MITTSVAGPSPKFWSPTGALIPNPAELEKALRTSQALETAIERVRDSADSPKEPVSKAFAQSFILALGQPAGEVTLDGLSGSESDLLHFEEPRDNGVAQVYLPVFTSLSSLKTALLNNLEWGSQMVLVLSGGELASHVDDDVALLIDPWTELEFKIPPRQEGSDAGRMGLSAG